MCKVISAPHASVHASVGRRSSGGVPPRQRGHHRGESLCRTLEMGIRTPELFSLVLSWGLDKSYSFHKIIRDLGSKGHGSSLSVLLYEDLSLF